MLYANYLGERVRAAKGISATCPICHSPVLAKCGSIKIPHWAHCSIKDCDPWSEGETPWHMAWKGRFPVEWQEVVVGPHRADIRTPDGVVIEFQHSFIAPAEIKEREEFYNRMLWVFDASSYRSRLELCDVRDSVFFSWKNIRSSQLSVGKPLLWDLGDMLIFVEVLQEGGGYGRRVEFNGAVPVSSVGPAAIREWFNYLRNHSDSRLSVCVVTNDIESIESLYAELDYPFSIVFPKFKNSYFVSGKPIVHVLPYKQVTAIRWLNPVFVLFERNGNFVVRRMS